ncbi:MAG: sensor histidine kinase [Haloferacaceae archaeon]
MQQTTPRSRSVSIPTIISGGGCLLVGLTLVEIGVQLLGSSSPGVSFVMGVVLSLPFAVLLVVGGYRLGDAEISETRYPRIAIWTAAGTVSFGVFLAVFAVLAFDSFWLRVGTVRWGVSIGAGGGFLAGLLNARSIEQAVATERAVTRAEAAEQQQRRLEYLNSVLRHEVLNTVNVIEGYADQLESRTDDERRQDVAAVIRRQAVQLTHVTTDVRVLLAATISDSRKEPVDAATVLREELRKLTDQYPAVETRTRIPDEVYVRTDEFVRHLFANLLTNPVEHNDASPPRVTVTVTTSPETVTVDVEDNGSGVPADVRDDLFDPTPRTDTSHGLGLTTVAWVADRYDGRVSLSETGPDGSVFTVELPHAPTDATPAAEPVGKTLPTSP